MAKHRGKPNIILVMSDQHAPGVLGCCGDCVVRTPHIDRLAAGGTRFDNAYCSNPVCVPSRMSMLTGRHSHAINVWCNADCLSPGFATWPLLLRLAGYETVIAGRNHMLWGDRRYGFGHRLCGDEAEKIPWIAPGRTGQGTPVSMPQGVPATLGARESTVHSRHDDDAARHALDWLAGAGPGPFALFVGFYQPHAPFVTTPEFYGLYEDGAIEERLARRPRETLPLYRPRVSTRDITPAQVTTAARAYYGMVSHVDRLVGDIVAAVERRGMLEDTVIIYTSDHGEMLGAHGIWHKMVFYEDSVRVPMIVCAPGRFDGNRVVPHNVSLLDLFPTLLDLADYSADLPLDGRSLLPLLRGDARERDNAVIAETIGVERGFPGRMLKRDHLKLLLYHGREPVLFDLAADLGETRDFAGDPAYRDQLAGMCGEARRGWNPESVNRSFEEGLRQLYYHYLVGLRVGLRV